MEYSLTVLFSIALGLVICLNPYSNGILPDFQKRDGSLHSFVCLNPYSNGILPDIIFFARCSLIWLS